MGMSNNVWNGDPNYYKNLASSAMAPNAYSSILNGTTLNSMQAHIHTGSIYSNTTSPIAASLPLELVCDVCGKKIEGKVRHLLLGARETVGNEDSKDSQMVQLDCVIDVCMDCIKTKTLEEIYAILWVKREAKDKLNQLGHNKDAQPIPYYPSYPSIPNPITPYTPGNGGNPFWVDPGNGTGNPPLPPNYIVYCSSNTVGKTEPKTSLDVDKMKAINEIWS